MTPATTSSRSSGRERIHAKSKLSKRARTSRPGSLFVVSAQPRNMLAANMSKKLRTSVLETTVVYVLPGIARCASTIRTASPARAGMIALIPTPAR